MLPLASVYKTADAIKGSSESLAALYLLGVKRAQQSTAEAIQGVGGWMPCSDGW